MIARCCCGGKLALLAALAEDRSCGDSACSQPRGVAYLPWPWRTGSNTLPSAARARPVRLGWCALSLWCWSAPTRSWRSPCSPAVLAGFRAALPAPPRRRLDVAFRAGSRCVKPALPGPARSRPLSGSGAAREQFEREAAASSCWGDPAVRAHWTAAQALSSAAAPGRPARPASTEITAAPARGARLQRYDQWKRMASVGCATEAVTRPAHRRASRNCAGIPARRGARGGNGASTEPNAAELQSQTTVAAAASAHSAKVAPRTVHVGGSM